MVYDKWMMRQSSGKCTSSNEALVQAKDFEAKFLASLSAKGVLDTSVQNLCSKLRDLYENIILTDHAFAEAQNVEHSLWQLHYRQIESFRRLVSSDKEWSIAHDGRASTAFSKEEWRDLLQSKPALVGFRSFLTEASGFYHELILKLRASCGLVLNLWDGMHDHETEAAKFKRCQQSCYRCLVNLGDYARYKEFYVGNDPTSYDFSTAADFYRKAIAHWPVGGQPHNQLAVLAVYVEDELLAVYHYFRSLAVEKPFPTTRENLTILFDKNRVKYEVLPPVPVKFVVPTSRPTSRRAHEGVKSSRVSKPSRRTPAKRMGKELISCFFVRFVRLNGLFFTKTSLENFEEVFAGVLHDLRELLALNDKDLELALGSGSCFGMAHEIHGAFGAIKLVVILICTLENVISGPRYTKASMQNVLIQNVSTALLTIVGHLMQRCAEAHDASGSPLLPAMLVFLEWLSYSPAIIREVEKEDEQFKLLSVIWKQFIGLLNRLCDEEKSKSSKEESSKAESSPQDFKMGVALWEDFELQGFSPLSSAHGVLSYGERPKGNDTDITKDQQFRVHRLVAARNALASIAVGSSMEMIFCQGIAKVNRSKEEKKADHGIVENTICRPIDVAVAAQIKDEVELQHNKQACRDDDDDEEELIVFKPAVKEPAAKEQIVMAASGCSILPQSLLSDTAYVFPKAAFLCAPGLTVATLSSVSDSIESSMAPNPECLPNPSTLYNASIPRVETCHVDSLISAAMSSHSKDLRDLTAIRTLTEKYEQLNFSTINQQGDMPLIQQPSRNHPMRPSMHDINDIEMSSSLGLRKAVNSLGVIGQPKQIQTCMPATVNDSKNEGLNRLHGDMNHYTAMSHTVNSFAQNQSPFTSGEKLSTEVQGRSHAGRAGPDLSPSVFKQSVPYIGAVMCPPPGFGPRPLNPRMSYPVGKSGYQQEDKEQLKLDNQCWSKELKSTANYAEKHKFPPGYSLWSNVNNKVLQPGGGTLSSPYSGPLLSRPDESPTRVHLQQPFQTTNEEETWSLFGSTAGFNWTPSIRC
eukprot:c24936_g1_i1 orf=376-3477(+)